jgi:hypothetical protein
MARVAVSGDVVATPSPATTLAGAPGAWAAGPVTEITDDGLQVGGKSVVHRAECTFIFTNGNTGVTTPVKVTLAPSPAALHAAGQDLLLRDDAIVEQGNRLEVTGAATGPLLSKG